MKIAILGAGAMGSLFGCCLSRNNDVLLIDNNLARVESIRQNGITLVEKDNSQQKYSIRVTLDTSAESSVDLIIVFVKSMFTEQALENNKALIGENTYVLSMQNGAGHEEIISRFVDKTHIIIGTTQHNSSFMPDGRVFHGGGGQSVIGLMSGDSNQLQSIAENFCACSIETEISDLVKKQVWRKLLLNASASSLTAVLQCPLGFLIQSKYAYSLFCCLLQEAVATANASISDEPFVYDQELKRICTVLENAPNGYTSIYSDIMRKVDTEVNFISGYVASQADKVGINVPYQHFVVNQIHAMEEKNRLEKNG